VNFRQTGMLGASPADVVSYLARLHDLPGLAGMTVVLVGAGDTAPPQLPPQHQPAGQRGGHLVRYRQGWRRRVGASRPGPAQWACARARSAVLLVPVPSEPAWTPPGTTGSSSAGFVFPDSGPVGFEPNTTVFRQPAAAMAALRPLALYLAATPSARIELTAPQPTGAPWPDASTWPSGGPAR